MPPPFNIVKASIFEKVKRIFAEQATWTSLDGGSTYTGTVLFKAPAAEYELDGGEYSSKRYYIEYLADEFPGLADRVNSRSTRAFEVVFVNGEPYHATYVMEMRDGDVTRVSLVPARTDNPINLPRP